MPSTSLCSTGVFLCRITYILPDSLCLLASQLHPFPCIPHSFLHPLYLPSLPVPSSPPSLPPTPRPPKMRVAYCAVGLARTPVLNVEEAGGCRGGGGGLRVRGLLARDADGLVYQSRWMWRKGGRIETQGGGGRGGASGSIHARRSPLHNPRSARAARARTQP